MNLHVGTVMSLPATSTGTRVLCVPAARDARRDVGESVGRRPSATAAPPDAAFQASLEKIRARGLESSVDAPSPAHQQPERARVRSGRGALALALTVIGSTGSIDVAADGRIARALLGAAREIGAELAAQPSLLASSAS